VPADGRITLTDYAGRNWGPELVHYRIDTARFVPGRLALLDDNDKAVPFQIKTTDGKGLLMFVAAVPKGKSATYKLQPAATDRSRENSAVFNRAAGDGVEIGNESLTLRLPKVQKQQFPQPVDAQKVPAPILGWKQTGYDWQGGARFVTERLVAQHEVRVLDDGPATVAYEVRYRFQPAGQYVFQVRVCAGIPVALVTEEFDFEKVTEGQDFLVLGLGEKWSPQQIGFTTGESPTAPVPLEPFAPYVEKKSKEQTGPLKNVGAYAPPEPFMPGKNLVALEKIVPGMPWGAFKSGCELRSVRGTGEKAAVQSTSLFPLHTGSWRRMMSLGVWHDPARGVQVALPISVRLTRWYLDMVDDRSPFSSHEHDGTLPPTYGRREWGLGFGIIGPDSSGGARVSPAGKTAGTAAPQQTGIGPARVQLGCVGLDRYKNWVLDWPEDRTKAVYPAGLVTPAVAARVKQALAQHPERELLEKLYIIDGKPETALDNAKRVLETFRHPSRGEEWQIVSISSYYTTYQHLWTIWANSALACPTLPAEQRQELRRYLALYAYLFSDPDFDPRGSGCHQGNPNMAVGRSMALATMAPMLADHRRYAYWMNQLRGMATFRIASNTEPGGAWFEPPIYQMYGPTRSVNVAQVVLRNCGIADLSAEGWHKAALTYDANLTMPDPRFKGWRILPGMGNSGNTLEGIFGISMAAFDASDRDFAGFLRAMHRLVSGNNRVSQGNEPDYSFCFLPDVPERPRTLRTTFVPGYGVMFRAHFGSPDETAMLLRCGYNKSHWDMDDLNTVLYGKGAPLSPGTGYQYYYGPAQQNEGIYHNRVKVGRLDAHEPFGRVENHVQDYGFGESVDYAVGREYYPPEYFADGRGDMEWRRHVMFLKSARPEGANYFVLRDTFPTGSQQPTWWHWLNLDGPEMIVPRANTIEMKTKYGAGTHFWFAGRQQLDAKAVMTFDYGLGPNYHHRAFGKQLGVPNAEDKESKTIFRVAGKPGEDFFYVVYPHKDAERLPSCTQLGRSCLKIVTPESTDYVFASDVPLEFEKEDVLFAGKAGAIRVFADRIVFCLAGGSGQVGYKGCILEGPGPWERVLRPGELKPGLTKIPGGYEKQIVSVDLGEGIRVTGEAPFEAKLDGQAIRIKTRGRARVLDVTLPPWILRPELKLDGRQWMAGWTDYASSNWGRMKDTWLAAVSTLDGEHELVITNMVFPPVWQRPFESAIVPAAKDGG
jgi:hypothetical protein